ncbi:MAG: hypothetical protein P8O05_01015 [Flavobacteriales bacterium]|nr:hypothetical protein [Flavobacteriales bacterium]MDG2246492.1 hypothetical protein [Flavobacteriales bacterium]
MTPGILSIFFALGTVLGLALVLFSLAKKSKTMRYGGIATFLVGFFGLIFLLSKYGQHDAEGSFSESSVRWKIAQWENTYDEGDGKLVKKDLTKLWEGTIYLILDESEARFGDNGKTFIQRGFTTTDSTWSFAVGNMNEAPPLSGTYSVSHPSENEAILRKDLNGEKEFLWLRKLE